MKLAYIKNGDAIEQLARLAATHSRPMAGPDAFLADLLHTCDGERVLLVSAHRRARRFRDGRLQALVYGGHPGAPPWRTAHEFGSVLLQLMRFRPDRILCGRRGGMLWAAFLAAKLLSVPLVYSRHDSPMAGRYGLRALLDRIDASIILRADACICHGPYMREQLLALGVPEERIFTFEVSTEDLRAGLATKLETGADAGERDVILYLGRLAEEKGVLELLDAAAPLLRRDVARLKFVGDGPERERLQRHARTLGVARRVLFAGRIPHEALGHQLRGARLLAAPTRRACEARSMAVLEALLAGVPVIAPDGGAFPYLVEHGGNGLLYETDSLGGLRKALEAMYADEALWRRLCDGARASGERLATGREPTFGQAAEQAFTSVMEGGGYEQHT